jgi:hypothetical protein
MSFFFRIFLILFFAALKLEGGQVGYKYDLAVVSIFRNEARFLKEWIEFHKLVGVQHFYLYNNLSNDNYLKVLKPYIDRKEVDLVDWPYETDSDGKNWGPIQIGAYNDALYWGFGNVKWLAVLDTDEFLFPVEKNNLREFLRDYEGFGGVCVNWQMYGTSNVKKIPKNKLMIESLLLKSPPLYPPNRHVKLIVRPESITSFGNPHHANFIEGSYAVNSDKNKCLGELSPVVIDNIRINHYWSRDEDFFYNEKIPRRSIWGVGASGTIKCNEEINKISDEAILKYVPKLRKKMGFVEKS